MGLCDLDGAQSYVQDVQAKYMNDLLSIGVAGFRVDAAKHMWVADIEALQAKLNDVNSGGRPYFYMEVIDQCKYLGKLSVHHMSKTNPEFLLYQFSFQDLIPLFLQFRRF